MDAPCNACDSRLGVDPNLLIAADERLEPMPPIPLGDIEGLRGDTLGLLLGEVPAPVRIASYCIPSSYNFSMVAISSMFCNQWF
jgi:hypothetical protein